MSDMHTIADSFSDDSAPMRDHRGMTIIVADPDMKAWDREVAPRLWRMKSYADYARKDCIEVLRQTRALPIIPGFETQALASIDAALADVRMALAQLEMAREEYGKKPVAAA